MDPTDSFENRKVELSRQLDDARHSIFGSVILIDEQIENKRNLLGQVVKLPQKASAFFSQNSFQKLAVATAGGLLLSKVARRKKSTHKSSPKDNSILKSLLILLLKPLLQRLVIEKSRELVAHYMERQETIKQANQASPRG